MKATNIKLLLTICFLLFCLKSPASTWYVNDGVTTGDIYCSATGNNGGLGTAASPFATVAYVIANKTLSAGDKIYIDAGNYSDAWTFNSNADGGSSGNPLIIQGAGVSLTKLTVTSGSNAAYINAAGNSYITFNNIYFESANAVAAYVGDNSSNIIFHTCSFKVTSGSSYVVQFYGGESCRCMFSTVYHTSTGDGIGLYYGSNHVVEGNTVTLSSKAAGNRVGIFLNGTSGASVANSCTIASNKISGANYGLNIQQQGTGNLWLNNYVWDCDYGIWADNGGTDHPTNTFKFNSLRSDKDCMKGDFNGWTIKNNILYSAGGSSYYCIKMNDATHDPTFLNYNLYYYPSSGNAASRNGTAYTELSSWRNLFNSNETNGITHNPLFASSTNLDLQSGSPAIDSALADATVNDDVRRNSAYVRGLSNQDIGAYEYNATLAVELLNFYGEKSAQKNILYWTTASEINSDFFTLERSYDGVHFFPVATIKAAGFSAALLHYDFTDNTAENAAVVYYRLKEKDFDGALFVSHIVAFERENSPDFKIYPNPCNNGKLFLQSDYEGPYTMELYNLLGEKIMQEEIQNSMILLNEDIATGTYFIRISWGQKTFSEKIILEN